MYRAIVFGGTTEGNEISQFLASCKANVLVRVATEYGATRLEESEYLSVMNGRLNGDEMKKLFEEKTPDIVVDATHPYAREATENISSACEQTGTDYIRLLRTGLCTDDTEIAKEKGLIKFNTIEEAVAYLNKKEGIIFAATGSKELHKYTAINNYEKRVVARVLSTAEVASECENLGFRGENLICMQGPFSKEMNVAMLKDRKAAYLVTKESGKNGGYGEKIEAAREAGCIPVIIGCPFEGNGFDMKSCKSEICRRLGIKPKQEVFLVGIGTGSRDMLTIGAKETIEKADLIIGAGRMIDLCTNELPQARGKTIIKEYNSESIKKYILNHPEHLKTAVIFSGDVGFFSGAKGMIDALKDTDCDVKCVPGISSLIYFMSKISTSWEDAVIANNHGTETSLVSYVRDSFKVISILGKKDDASLICEKLKYYGINKVKIFLGERLSYKDEKITEGGVDTFIGTEHDSLAVIVIINEEFESTQINKLEIRHDEEFIRGRVPMTKYDVRGASMNRLAVTANSVCYDVGAGTGSISIEMAIKADRGQVFAIEKNKEAIELLKTNRGKFACDNLTIIEGLAPEAMADLPAPTHLFIGGSSGNMREIIESAISQNTEVRVVINCIAIESAYKAIECARAFCKNPEDIEISQIAVSEGYFAGEHTMMKGGNPIYIIAFGGKK